MITTAAAADTPLTVEILTARSVADERTYSLTGEVRARDTLSASFPAGGRIADILVETGDVVTTGAKLARLDSVQQEQALRAAEAGLSTAGADHGQAIEDLQRQEALLERGATTRIARDSAEDALRITEGALAQAQAELDRAEKALNDTVLRAPGDATVTRRMAETGQVVGAAQPVLELALASGFDAVFDVPEGLLTLGPPPESVTLNPIGAPDTTFQGHIDEVSPVIDAQTGTVAVTVAIDTPPPGLAYGDPVRGTVVRIAPAHVTLPYSVITATADGPAVWQVDPDTMAATLLPVRVDRYETGQVIIADGIEDGTLVVGNGQQLLYPGRVVQPVETTE
ncbi:MAG: efflux RND transporter periplasmic adaptor subunit [Albidovulum sp.]|uniref:efflux RND transporter periplasmic adaptor subunit n=1 Tax=Albidovulum sp. TaxID=1872424 RepID=UPI003C82E988